MSEAWRELERRNRRAEMSESRGLGAAGCGIVAIVALALAAVFYFAFVEQVDATQSCAITSMGRKLLNPDGTPRVVGPGWHVMMPDKSLKCFTIRRKTMELVAGEPTQSNSKADYVDYAIQARTKDGIDLYSMLTMQYHLEPQCAGVLYPLIVDDEGVKEQIVKARVRSVVPQVLSTHGALEQYQGNITGISDEIETKLSDQLEGQCVKLDLFELKRGDFNDKYEEAIRARAQEVEAAEKKKLEQQTAEAEAERKRIEADGEAKKKGIDADAAAYVTTTQANADAKAETARLEARAKAIQANPALVEWERIQQISNAGAIYLPESALPIYQVPQPAPTPAP